MRPDWTCIILLISACNLSPFAAGDCPYKECQCYGTYIVCAGLGLTSIPFYNSDATTGYLTLTLDSNQITEISAGSLPTGLSEISLMDNPITTIDDNAFDELSTTLESLYFSNAQFRRIPDAFLHLNSLQHLNIISSNVLDWNIGAMAHIGETLQNLNLEEVGFTTWPVWLTYFKQLNELSLQDNSLSSIPDNAFDILSNNLTTLTLSNNSFVATPKSLFNLKNLLYLDFENNKISNLTWLPQPGKLSSLGLNINQISDAHHLSEVLRPYANSLNTVILSYNRLTAIPELSFMTKIDTFDLSYNLISDARAGSVYNTTYVLELCYNRLRSIPTIFSGLKLLISMSLSHNIIQAVQGEHIPSWVTSLDLQFNLVTELTDTSFPENSALQFLLLDNNPLVKISNLALKNLGSLNNLSLQHTKLIRLPLGLAYLTSILYLDLRNNPGLVCTCLEKSLKGKLTSNVEISGDCGNISIYDFFAILSPNCPQ
ncbi:hypothetical protein BsWGS_23832 [Bradybaena similaris]